MSSDNDKHLLERFLKPERVAKIRSTAELRASSLCLVLDHVNNYHNISAVLRSADAFGIQNIHMIGREFDYNEGISLGTERWLTLHRYDTAAEAAKKLTELGFELVILAPEDSTAHSHLEQSVPVFELPFERPLALVFGNEHRGINEELASKASYRAHIPMLGFVESLNISVSAAITMFCSMFSQPENKRRVSLIKQEEKIELLEDWFQKDIRKGRVRMREVKIRDA